MTFYIFLSKNKTKRSDKKTDIVVNGIFENV